LSDDLFPEWETKSLVMRSKFNLPPHATPWKDYGGKQKEYKGLAVTPRILDAIEVAWGSKPPMERDTADFYVDVSQCVSRKKWGPLRTFCGGTSIYSFARDEVLNFVQCLMLQGLPPCSQDVVANLPGSSLKDLIGESMCAPCLGTVLASIYLLPKAPWLEAAGTGSSSPPSVHSS
jgi:hypothetical protein